MKRCACILFLLFCLWALAVPQALSMSEAALIQMAEDSKKEIEKSNDTIKTLKKDLEQALQTLMQQKSEMQKYKNEADGYGGNIRIIQDRISTEIGKIDETLRKSPGLTEVASIAIKPIKNEYTRIASNINNLISSINDLLSNAIQHITSLMSDLEKATTVSSPAILKKGDEVLKGIEEFKKEAPNLAKLLQPGL